LDEFIHLVFGVKRAENVIHIPAKHVRGASNLTVMATSDHNMIGSENSEISSKPTLKKQTE